jgi:hypothetical protein
MLQYMTLFLLTLVGECSNTTETHSDKIFKVRQERLEKAKNTQPPKNKGYGRPCFGRESNVITFSSVAIFDSRISTGNVKTRR